MTNTLQSGDQVRIGNGKLIWTVQGIYGHWGSVTTQTIRHGIRYDQVKRVHDLSKLVKVS